MSKAKVIVDFSSNRYTDNGLNQKAAAIVLCLLANVNYLELAEIVQLIKTKNELFGSLLAKMQEGSKQVTAEKNVTRAELESLLSNTGAKVQEISGDNELLILNSGYDIKRKGAPVGMLEMPTGLFAKSGTARASLDVFWDVVIGANMYEIQYTQAPSTVDSVWFHLTNTKHRTTIVDLIRGQAYAIKVAGAGSDIRRTWSDEIITYVN